MLGGRPARVLRLAPGSHLTDSDVLAMLERRGLAHAEPPADPAPADLTVVIPVKDRAAGLARTIAALDGRFPVVIVDDGSAVAVPDAAVRHESPRGPAAARQAAFPYVTTALVVFVDSDVRIGATDLDRLAWWLSYDPSTAAIAPRVIGSGRWRCPLDLGPDPALVAPLTDVAYLPSACLMMRREAWAEFWFDPELRYGEDVDLVWRLIAAGHRVRYDPGAQAIHDEPASLIERLQRAHHYGSSAPALHQRHAHSVAPLVFSPVHVVALTARSPVLAGFALGRLAQRLHTAGVPPWLAVPLTARSLLAAASGLGSYTTKVAWPLAGRTWPFIALPHLRTWWRWRPPTDPFRWSATGIAEDVAYGTGVWRSARAARNYAALSPVRASRVRPSTSGGAGPSTSRRPAL